MKGFAIFLGRVYTVMAIPNRRISMSMVLTRNKQQWIIFQCSHCRHLPFNSVQTDCGHLLCVQCLDSLFRARNYSCPEIACGKPLKEDGRLCYFKDDFVNTKVLQIPVACANSTNGCPWTGHADEFLVGHVDLCQYRNPPEQ